MRKSLGLMGRSLSCPSCERPLCEACAPWHADEHHPSKKLLNWLDERELCSDGCAFKRYRRFLAMVDAGTPIILHDVGHVGLMVWARRDEEEMEPHYIHITRRGLDPADRAGDAAPAPEVRPLCDRVKRDLAVGGWEFTEDYSTRTEPGP